MRRTTPSTTALPASRRGRPPTRRGRSRTAGRSGTGTRPGHRPRPRHGAASTRPRLGAETVESVDSAVLDVACGGSRHSNRAGAIGARSAQPGRAEPGTEPRTTTGPPSPRPGEARQLSAAAGSGGTEEGEEATTTGRAAAGTARTMPTTPSRMRRGRTSPMTTFRASTSQRGFGGSVGDEERRRWSSKRWRKGPTALRQRTKMQS